MGERKYKAVLRRIHSDKLREWLAQLYDMYEYAKFPMMGYIVDVSRELNERGARDEERDYVYGVEQRG